MVYHWQMKSKTPVAALVAVLLLLPGWTAAQDSGPDAADEQQAEEREQAQKLRRAQEELELRRAEAARRLEGAQLRQAEIQRLQGLSSGIARRESYLGGETFWARRERDSLSRDPADLSSMARRSGLDHQLYQQQNELERASTLRQGVTSQLNGLQLR
jgi:hypothetical protein